MLLLGRDLAEKQGALSEKHCASAISLFEENPDMVVDLAEEGFYKRGTQYSDLKIKQDVFPKFYQFMVSQIQNTLIEYTELLKLKEPIGTGIEKISIMKYYPAVGNFHHHFDAQGRFYNRRLAIIWYLNNVKEGGQLHFPTSSKPVTISPELGKVVVTPCDWTHSHNVTAPITNERYSIITFITI
jgi:hypothetical protein